MKHFIIGTAGHVDHGKTMLIKALTGKETDRLKEEKERGISIELGFAPFILPSGTLAGVVDVPGHERFIKNMLAGVGGMDLVLLVVAADEGIMPQTREHLEIIDLLQVSRGVIVLTKTDLVETDWIDLVKEEVRELVQGTVLENAPFAEVSAVTGEGINELTNLIDTMAGELKERSVSGNARMSVDRVFSITGFGTVVTGTLVEGRLIPGETVEILPDELEARVRTLQVHGQKVDSAVAGQRVAVNLAGIDREQIKRGSVLAAPGILKPSHRLDIRFRLLASAEKALANRARIRVHIGTEEILARIVLLETEELNPGDMGYAQLVCEEAMTAAKGDRLVVRSYSPMHTIGGGQVIDSFPKKHKRFDPEVIKQLKTKEKGTPEEIMQQFMISAQQIVFSENDLLKIPGIDELTVKSSLQQLLSSGAVKNFSSDNKSYYILSIIYNQKGQDLVNTLKKYHMSFPLRSGISKEEIRSKHFTGLNNKLFNAVIDLYQKDSLIKAVGESLAAHSFVPGPDSRSEKTFQQIENRFMESGFQTPGWDEIGAELKLSQSESEEILNYFLSEQILVKLEDNIVIHSNNLNTAKKLVTDFIRDRGEMSLGEARDLFKTSRKFALPLMNYFDKEKITRRVEDKRVLY